MKPTKIALAALGASAIAALTPAPSQAAITALSGIEYTTTTNPLYGAAQTSDSKLGLTSSGLFTYNNDLSSGSGVGIAASEIHDAGTWNDNYVMVQDGSSAVDLIDLSTGFSIGSSSISGTNAAGLSSAFDYNGAQHFAIIDGNDSMVKFYEWGNSTPVATGPNVGSNYNGLEVITSGSVSDLSNVSLLVSRDAVSGAMLDQYSGGTIVQSYTDTSGETITDINYDASSGILTASHDVRGRVGALTNYDFANYVIPEPSDFALLLGVGALASVAFNRRKE